MMLYERPNPFSPNFLLKLDTSRTLLNFDCHSFALNNQETRLLLVSNHEVAVVNVETISDHIDPSVDNDSNILVTSLSDIKLAQLFDIYNTNRPIVEWSYSDPYQYAVAIDRLVRFYTVDHSRISETSTIIESQHQRPISAISYAAYDPHWLLTGSLDGQIQLWDTRQALPKSPASLKFAVSTPFSIRQIQWPSGKSDHGNKLAVQCDRSVRIYDIRRSDFYISSPTDLEHSSRITSMDWVAQTNSIATLSKDYLIKVFSTNGEVLAESLHDEQSPYTLTKMRSTSVDNLFVCASRDPASPTYGFIGWRWDEDQYIRPLTDRIISTTPTPIIDFCFVNNSRFVNLFNNLSACRYNDDISNRLILLALCRDGQLYLVDMDSTFRQAWTNHHARSVTTSLSDSSSSIGISRPTNFNRQNQINRKSSTMIMMDMIKDEGTDGRETDDDDDDNLFGPMTNSPPDKIDSSDISDENESSNSYENSTSTSSIEISIDNEFDSLSDSYGSYLTIETKDKQRRVCTIRCIYSSDNTLSFRIYLFFSRHYPIISQLFVRFKLTTVNNDERLKDLQSQIQKMFDETSTYCFYHGQLCLHKCLIKLQHLIENHHKYKKISTLTTNQINKKRELSSTNSDIDTLSGITTSNQSTNGNAINGNTNRLYGTSSSSTRTSDSQLSGVSFSHVNRRTCGARFSGGIHLICFGRISSNNEIINSSQSPTPATETSLSRVQPLQIRSTSLTVGVKTRENSGTDEQTIYRPTIVTQSTTNTVQIQSVPNPTRMPMSSAPIRSSLSTSVYNDSSRISTVCRRPVTSLIPPPSTVSIYDVSILMPVSRKLADDYKIDLYNALDMCEMNEELSEKLGKDDLARCWRLLDGLLAIQPSLQDDDTWFQTPIAQGLIKHLVLNYVTNGDIQSASMFLLTMSQTPYLKTKIESKLVNEHDHDPILYAYANLLHRWKHFYKRTQILSQIDRNCQTPAPFTQTNPTTATTAATTTTNIICSICLQPVLGQHFLCAICGHGGHLTHMHDWFSLDEIKHKFCPEKDCTCRCIIKQQEMLTTSIIQTQPQTSSSSSSTTTVTTPRSYFSRHPSNSSRTLQ